MDTKQSIIDLVNTCYKKGLRKVVSSPGSRNAPLIIAFAEHGGFETFSIPDERVAGFFALGMAQQTEETVTIISTSGSAALNFAPALAEAYYQRIPLLALTADRPPEWIDQGNGQTMRQFRLYENYIKKSYEINHETLHEDEFWFNNRIYNEALNETQIEPKGPVHINIPLREPLYNFEMNFDNEHNIKIIEQVSPPPEFSDSKLDDLANTWNAANKKLILCGITKRSNVLNKLLAEVAKDPSVIILTETTSNLYHSEFIEQIDRFLFSINEHDYPVYQPDLLLTFGTNIVSKKVKQLFRSWKIKEHWHLDETDIVIDTFKSLTKHLRSDLLHFFEGLVQRQEYNQSDYKNNWQKRNNYIAKKHLSYLENTKWSDLTAYKICLEQLPSNCNLHMANSTAVRYVQLMEKRADISYYSNRGVAGIDGCTSTASGASWVNENQTILVTGDVAFLYDSNALWHPYVHSNFRIIIFNNEGGNIFRFIPGPAKTRQLERYFEGHHSINAEHLAKTYDIGYFAARNQSELEELLPSFWQKNNNKTAILEIFTPRLENDKILKDYFNNMQ